jgi:hypothetical protein
MSISPSGENRESYADDLFRARILASLGVPIFCCKLDSDGNPLGAFGWEKTQAGVESFKAIDRWREGMGLGALGGYVFDIADLDPRNGGAESWPRLLARLAADPPEIFGIAATPSHGAHFWIASQGIARTKLLKGIDFQARGGFVFIAPTVRPSKADGDKGKLRPYTWISPVSQQATPWIHEPSLAFRNLPWDQDGSGGNGSGRSRKTPEQWMEEAVKAETGDQRGALLGLVMEYMFRGIPEVAIADTLRNFLPKVPVFDDERPWYPARGGNPDRWIQSLLRKGSRFRPIPDADEDELAGIRDIEPRRVSRESPEENSFWQSRESLSHIRDFARSRRTGPWAVFGEVLAEAICHTPPTLQLPSSVGSNGTLNMLIALVGHSGAGKSAAEGAAEEAFRWEGIPGEIPDLIDRIPVGSGEGLVKSYAFNRKNEDTKRMELHWERLSAIITIEEIDTLRALSDRGGATISGELRKFYNGGRLGFGYADTGKRTILPKNSYRGCIVAGVQPGRGRTILDDIEGGFPQRWLWLPADDPYMPDDRPPEVQPADWSPPYEICNTDSGEILVMKVCDAALTAIDRARVRANHNDGSDMESHLRYTQLKVSAGLALLDGRCDVSDEDWSLAEYVMSVSTRTRENVQQHLAAKVHEADLAAGRREGVRRAEADTSQRRSVNTRIAKRLLMLLSYDEFRTVTKITRNEFNSADRSIVPDVLIELVTVKLIEREEYTYHGRKFVRYRKIRPAK